MRIQLETDGGLALIPGLSRPLTVDTKNLEPADAAELSRLLEDAGFFARPASGGEAPPGAADGRRYTLSITDGARRHSVSFSDPVTDSHLAALRDFVRAHARGG